MKPRSTEFYSDAYAYATGYYRGRKTYGMAEDLNPLPDYDLYTPEHKQLFEDGYMQGQRDYERYDHMNQTPAYAPIQSGLEA